MICVEAGTITSREDHYKVVHIQDLSNDPNHYGQEANKSDVSPLPQRITIQAKQNIC